MPNPPDYWESNGFPAFKEIMAHYPKGRESKLRAMAEKFKAYKKADTVNTLYVRRDILNGAQLVDWAKTNGFKTTLPADDMHVTVAFSKMPVDWALVGEPLDTVSWVPASKERWIDRLGENGEAVVLRFSDPSLQARHELMRARGASWDFPAYNPHITISWQAPDLDVKVVPPYTGLIALGPEVWQPINEDWKDTITEKSDG